MIICPTQHCRSVLQTLPIRSLSVGMEDGAVSRIVQCGPGEGPPDHFLPSGGLGVLGSVASALRVYAAFLFQRFASHDFYARQRGPSELYVGKRP